MNEPLQCEDGVEWVWSWLGQCVHTNTQVVGAMFGMISILFWIFAQSPQLYMNYVNGNSDSLALLFLVEWLLGDFLNLTGALLTHQLPTQIYTAIYFCCMDIALFSQFIYYRIKNGPKDPPPIIVVDIEGGYQSSSTPVRLKSILFGGILFCTSSILFSSSFISTSYSSTHRGLSTGRVLLNHNPPSILSQLFNSKSQVIGYIIGIVSAFMYLLSRIPQIIKNWKRKSTGGLSFLMFMFAVLGNITYALGILMQSCELLFILQKLPWLIGSLGTILFDFTIFLQFWLYDAQAIPPELLKSEQSPLINSDDESNASYGIDDRSKPSRIPHPPRRKKNAPISPLIYPAAQKKNYFVIKAARGHGL